MIFVDEKHLSARLACVASLVPAGARVADIGSDHAYLPAALVLDGKIDFAIAGEVVKGPYENAVREIKDHQLEGQVIPRLADGLAAIEPADKVDTITIAGMGGSLIASILEKGKDKLTEIKRLVLQPNVGESQLREWLIIFMRLSLLSHQLSHLDTVSMNLTLGHFYWKTRALFLRKNGKNIFNVKPMLLIRCKRLNSHQ